MESRNAESVKSPDSEPGWFDGFGCGLAGLQGYCRESVNSNKIFAAKERKDRRDKDLCRFFFAIYAFFCGQFVFGCGLAGLRFLRILAVVSLDSMSRIFWAAPDSESGRPTINPDIWREFDHGWHG